MSSTWTIKCDQGSVTSYTTFSDLGLGNFTRRLVNQAPDEVSFEAPIDFDSAGLFPYKSTCIIQKDGVTWFVGIVRTIPRSGEPAAERITYKLLGPWFWLNKIYEQLWRVYYNGSMQSYLKSRVIIGRAADGSRLTTGETIEVAVQCAIDAGAPIQIGDIDPDKTVPWEEMTDVSCAQIVTKMLRWTPEAVCWFDYATDPPTLHCRTADNQPEASYAIGDDPLAAVPQITPRYDLVVPGVKLIFESRSYVTGLPGGDQNWETITVQEAGTVDDVETVISTIELAGHHAQYTSMKITTLDIPADLNDKDWWKALLPELNANAAGDLIITDGALAPVPTLPRILINGSIQDWMTETDGSPIETESVTASANIARTKRGKIGNVAGVGVRDVPKKPLTLTNAETRWYRKFEGQDLAEPVPTALADALYAAWSRLWFDGQAAFIEDECATGLHPGHKLNLTGGLAEWETMDAPVQQVIEQVDSGATTIVFGFPGHLGRDNIRDLLRRLRNRQIPRSIISIDSGDPNDDDNGGGAWNLDEVPDYYGGVTPMEDQSATYTEYSDDDPVTQIEIKPEDTDWEEHKLMVAQDDGGVLKVRPGWVRSHD